MAKFFDTLAFSKKMIEAGMPREQAETLAILLKEAFQNQQQHLQETLDEAISTGFK